MDDITNTGDGLASLAAHVASRRDVILQAWRQLSEMDPELTTLPALSRSQFYDHMPQVLEIFERRLEAVDLQEKNQAATEQKARAAEHGLHRWHHGYKLREVMREWGHMHLVMVDELEWYAASHPDLQPHVMPTARRILAQLCSEGVSESASRYAEFQQIEALDRSRGLEQALTQMHSIQVKRSEFWRDVAHDLRGNLGVVRNAAALLTKSETSGEVRLESKEMLDRNMEALNMLLTDMMTLARLDAGQEKRSIAPFDAAGLMGELCASLQPMADDRGLFLQCEGPPSLPVQGDHVRVRRIARNLVINALKYTERGGVKVTWNRGDHPPDEHWVLCVEDTGPGITHSQTPLIGILKKSTDESMAVESRAEAAGDPTAKNEPAPTLASQSSNRPSAPGEGIGLSIVKRLCELLDATLELETHPGNGTTFRVTFPNRYPTVQAGD